MNSESFFKVYQANRFVGSTRPVMIVTADTTYKGYPFTEHFIITALPNNAIIQRPTYYGIDPASGPGFDDFPDQFSATSFFDGEMGFARDHLQNSIFTANRELHSELYASRMPLEFVEVGEGLLTQMLILGRNSDELRTIFDATRNTKLRGFAKSAANLPRVIRSNVPPRS